MRMNTDIRQSRLHTKSELTITDESKIGTTLDDVKFKQDVRTLTGNEHTFKLGNLDTTFRYAMQDLPFQCFAETLIC